MPLSSTPSKNNEQTPKEVAFPLGSGSALRYYLPTRGKPCQWESFWRWEWNDRLLKPPPEQKPGESYEDWKERVKAQAPKLGGWSNHIAEQIVTADFDHLPVGYDSFDHLCAVLELVYADSGLVLRTPSNKVKVIFIIQLPPGQRMSVEIAHQFLRRRLSPELFQVIDKTTSAQQMIALIPSMAVALHSGLIKLPVFNVEIIEDVSPASAKSLSDCISVETPSPVTLSIPINPAANLLPPYEEAIEAVSEELKNYVDRRFKRCRNRKPEVLIPLMRLLLGQPGLLRPEGFGLGSIKIGGQLGFEQGSISKEIGKFKEAGFLRVIKDTWKTGKNSESKTYSAIGPLRDAIATLYPTRPAIDLPKTSLEGRSNKSFCQLAWRYYNEPETFWRLVDGLPDMDQKNRRNRALAALNSARRKHKLEPIKLPAHSGKRTAS